MNMAPVGCYPALLVQLPLESSDIDQYGCFISYNKAVTDYNAMLKKELERARSTLPKASLIYFDTHSVLLQLFQHPNSYGTYMDSCFSFFSNYLTRFESVLEHVSTHMEGGVVEKSSDVR